VTTGKKCEANPQFIRTVVLLVAGPDDVTNPAALGPGNPVSGMPFLNVDDARSVIVIERSMELGDVRIDDELYTDPKTAMPFGDAKVALTRSSRACPCTCLDRTATPTATAQRGNDRRIHGQRTRR
jgi:NAD/NADP transhydrogenase beta subunit